MNLNVGEVDGELGKDGGGVGGHNTQFTTAPPETSSDGGNGIGRATSRKFAASNALPQRRMAMSSDDTVDGGGALINRRCAVSTKLGEKSPIVEGTIVGSPNRYQRGFHSLKQIRIANVKVDRIFLSLRGIFPCGRGGSKIKSKVISSTLAGDNYLVVEGSGESWVIYISCEYQSAMKILSLLQCCQYCVFSSRAAEIRLLAGEPCLLIVVWFFLPSCPGGRKGVWG